MAYKVFVSGCFDLLHSGHVAFLKSAASFGDVYVGVGKDETINFIKRKFPVNTEEERLFMIRSLCYVKDAWLNSGFGVLDFAEDLGKFRPDIFVVNEDGHSEEKAALCARLGIDYKVLKREPETGLPMRYSSMLRSSDEVRMAKELPYRMELCGGWLDLPMINRLLPGYVICAQLMPHPAYENKGGGLATSTRTYLELIKSGGLSQMEGEELSRLVFRYENGIDRENHPVSGAQDAIGLCMGGVSIQYYDKGYWPRHIQQITDDETLCWLEEHLSLYPLTPRRPDFNPLLGFEPQQDAINDLAKAAELCKNAIETRNLSELAESLNLCRKSQTTLYPSMLPPHTAGELEQLIAEHSIDAWKFTGAGGGGWIILLDAKNVPGAVPIKISVLNPLKSRVE